MEDKKTVQLSFEDMQLILVALTLAESDESRMVYQYEEYAAAQGDGNDDPMLLAARNCLERAAQYRAAYERVKEAAR